MAAISRGNDAEAIRAVRPYFIENWFRRPDIESFVADMRDPDEGRANLREWVEYQAANTDIYANISLAKAYYLAFGHIDLFIEAIDGYGPPSANWSDAETLESFGVYLAETGYRKTQHYLDRARDSGLIELWEHRGPPDFCSKETGEWVCW